MSADNSTGEGFGAAATWIALLGRGEIPTDGVADYCGFLNNALASRGVQLERVRVEWVENGWIRALAELRRNCRHWRGHWVLVQYTALNWSRRGFPFPAILLMAILRGGGARCAVVFHEPWGFAGKTPVIGPLRRASQDFVVRTLHRMASKSIFADPLHTVPWLEKNDPKATFIPLGANITERIGDPMDHEANGQGPKTIVIFCLSDPPHVHEEIRDISTAVRCASDKGVQARVVFVGRGTAEAKKEIAQVFQDIPVEISVMGLASADEVSEALAGADAMLCVRGRIYPRRGSAIAGIACGLPILGYSGEAEGTPLEEAGLILVPFRNAEALGAALTRVLTVPQLRSALREKSARAQCDYFSWSRIAKNFVEFLS